jgi:hypothetical protein
MSELRSARVTFAGQGKPRTRRVARVAAFALEFCSVDSGRSRWASRFSAPFYL